MLSKEELLAKAQTLNKKKNYNKVIKLLTEDILETYPNDDIYLEKAEAFYMMDKNELCRNIIEKALNINSKNAKAYNLMGHIYVDLKDNDKAIEYYNKAIELNPKYSSPYHGLGLIYTDKKIYNKAIEFYNKAIELNPKHKNCYDELGDVYAELKEYNKAIDAYTKAIALDPKYVYPYHGLGMVYAELKEYDKAIEAYNKAIINNPKYTNPYTGLGIIYANQKEYDKAIEAYSKAIEIDPKSDSPYFNRALVYRNIKNFQQAIDDFKEYLELTKNNPDYYSSRAQSQIVELKKLIKSTDYSNINELVSKIKTLLLFKGDCVTHYTSTSVVKVLILEESLFRVSEGAFLNDTSEGRELFKFLNIFNSFSLVKNDTVAQPYTQKPFIGSFVSETKHDNLTLWRMYGKEDKEEARGCSVTLDRIKLLDNLKDLLIPDSKTGTPEKTDEEFSFYRVAYKTQEKIPFIIPGAEKNEEKELNSYLLDLADKIKVFVAKEDKEVSDIQNLLELLNTIAYLFKSAEYQYEYELRLVVKGVGIEKKINTGSLPPKVYLDLVPINPLIKKITLGPKVDRADEWAAAFYYKLDQQGFHPDILISHLPFK